MNEVIKNYRLTAQLEFGKVQRAIDKQKETFKSTNWTDQESMIKAANKIWNLEQRLKDTLEVHKIILENLGEA